MLREIHIQNYAVIDSLSIEFGPGLNLLSGETGSGKSILVDALSLALGGRTSSDVIRTGEDRAVITAVFSAEGSAPWVGWLEEHGVAPGDDHDLILRREVQAGRKKPPARQRPACHRGGGPQTCPADGRDPRPE